MLNDFLQILLKTVLSDPPFNNKMPSVRVNSSASRPLFLAIPLLTFRFLDSCVYLQDAKGLGHSLPFGPNPKWSGRPVHVDGRSPTTHSDGEGHAYGDRQLYRVRECEIGESEEVNNLF